MDYLDNDLTDVLGTFEKDAFVQKKG